MNEFYDLLYKAKIFLKSIEPLSSKRWSFKVFSGIDLKGFYWLIISKQRASKLDLKDILYIEELIKNISKEKNINYKKIALFTRAKLGTNTKNQLKTMGIKNYAFV